jgi:hypothetical protein
MKVLDLVRYDPDKGCFVLKDNNPPRALNPWEELAQVDRPSIFMSDAYFRAKNPSNQLKNEEGLGYKLFGTYSKARQPNKHEGVLEHATPQAPRTFSRKTNPNV